MAPDGTSPTDLTAALDGFQGEEISWSPSGDRLAFTDFAQGSGLDGLYRMRPDGSETELLLTGAGDAALSPDGSYLVIAKAGDLWVRALDGSTPRALGLAGPGFDLAWIPE